MHGNHKKALFCIFKGGPITQLSQDANSLVFSHEMTLLDFTDVPLRFFRTVPLISLTFSFDFTEPLARRKPNGEPSTLTRRALHKE